MSVYRRGAVYWWHRQVSLGELSPHPIKFRMSLKTSEKAEARARALALDMELKMLLARVLADGAPAAPDQLAKAYNTALTLKRDQIARFESRPPFDDQKLRDEHIAMRQLFAAITRTGLAMSNPENIAAAAADPTLSGDQLGLISANARAYGVVRADQDAPQSPRSIDFIDPPYAFVRGSNWLQPAFVAHFMASNGIDDTEANRKVVLAVVAAAYSDAHKEAEARLAAPNEHANAAVPQVLRRMIASSSMDGRPQCADHQPPSPSIDQMASVSTSSPRQLTQAGIDMTLSDLRDRALAYHKTKGSWGDSAQRNARVIIDIFIAECGDLRMSEITWDHYEALENRLRRLPSVWGRSREDREGGFPVIFARGDALLEAWAKDPEGSLTANLPRAGLRAETYNRHINTLRQVLGHTRVVAKKDRTTTYLHPDLTYDFEKEEDPRLENERRPIPQLEELKALISSPVFTGCLGLEDRLIEGDIVIHDAMYWGMILLIVYGNRSNEFFAMPLANVKIDAPKPFFHIGAAQQQVKNANSRRKLPISPKMIELGFADYVNALRKRGEKWLFPELNTNAVSARKRFRELVFVKLLKHHFPNGTSALDGGKDIDSYSIRHVVATYLRLGEPKIPLEVRQAYIGHAKEGTIKKVYEQNYTVEELLPCVLRMEELIVHLPSFELNISHLK